MVGQGVAGSWYGNTCVFKCSRALNGGIQWLDVAMQPAVLLAAYCCWFSFPW